MKLVIINLVGAIGSVIVAVVALHDVARTADSLAAGENSTPPQPQRSVWTRDIFAIAPPLWRPAKWYVSAPAYLAFYAILVAFADQCPKLLTPEHLASACIFLNLLAWFGLYGLIRARPDIKTPGARFLNTLGLMICLPQLVTLFWGLQSFIRGIHRDHFKQTFAAMDGDAVKAWRQQIEPREQMSEGAIRPNVFQKAGGYALTAVLGAVVLVLGVFYLVRMQPKKPATYAECVLAHVKANMTRDASAAVCRACRDQFPPPGPTEVPADQIDGTLRGDYTYDSLLGIRRWDGTCTARLYNMSDVRLGAVNVSLASHGDSDAGAEVVDRYRIPVSIGPHQMATVTFKVFHEWAGGGRDTWAVVSGESQPEAE